MPARSAYELLFDEAREGLIHGELVYDQNNRPIDFIILRANESFLRISGLRELTGRKWSSLFSHLPKNDEKILEICDRLAMTGIPEEFHFHLPNRKTPIVAIAHSPKPGQFVASVQCQFHDHLIEQMLSSRESTLNAALSSMMDAVFITDADGRIIHANQAFIDTFASHHGITNDRPLDECIDSLEYFTIDGNRIPSEHEPARRALRGERIRQIEYRIRRTDANTDWIGSCNFSPIRDKEGRISGAVVVAHDTCEKRDAARKLEELTQRLQLATSSAGMGIWDWDIKGNTMHWDDRMLELYALKRETFSNRVEAWQDGVHPEDRARALAECMAALHGQKQWDTEFRVLHPDGNSRHIKATGLVLRDRDGNPTRMLGVNFDITARKEAEQELQKAYLEVEAKVEARTRELQTSEKRLKNAQKIARMGDFEMDFRSGKLTWSDGVFRIFGYTRGQVEPEFNLVLKSVPEDTRPRVQEAADSILKGADSLDFKHPFLRSDGTLGTLHCSAEAVRASDGTAERLSGVIQDVSEEEILRQEIAKAKENAERANRSKDLFLATLSHELRTPLTSILTWSQLLERATVPPERVQMGLRTIRESALAQNQLINELLDVSRIISGKLMIESQPVGLFEILKSAIETIRPTAEAKGLMIEEDLTAEDLLISGDAARLNQTLWNLFSNSIKFTPRGGKIFVKLCCENSKAGRNAVLSIGDTGKGIKAEFLPEIFNRFAQADPSSVRVHGGLGLGLSIVQSLVTLQGGTVEAASPGEGLGSTFTVRFPLLGSSTMAPSESRALHASGTPSLAPLKILLVEDDESTREALLMMLVTFGAEVRAARSAEECLGTLREFQPDVLISDLAMPREDGLSLIKRIRENGGRFPALALSAYADTVTRDQALRAGFQAHLAKPVDTDQLIAAILKLSTDAH